MTHNSSAVTLGVSTVKLEADILFHEERVELVHHIREISLFYIPRFYKPRTRWPDERKIRRVWTRMVSENFIFPSDFGPIDVFIYSIECVRTTRSPERPVRFEIRIGGGGGSESRIKPFSDVLRALYARRNSPGNYRVQFLRNNLAE